MFSSVVRPEDGTMNIHEHTSEGRGGEPSFRHRPFEEPVS